MSPLLKINDFKYSLIQSDSEIYSDLITDVENDIRSNYISLNSYNFI